ncbi:hypothetical protein [Deinococcus sp.]|uniref:hypothetical protein n=1 Tax=Deinococcus sp. TaxID=47478 RepID=UPI003B5BEB14
MTLPRTAFRLLALPLLLALAGCAPLITLRTATFAPPNVPAGSLSAITPARPGPLLPRPPNSPDVLIFGISGRCGPPCQAPVDSWDYLSERGTMNAIAEVFTGRGLKVQVSGYAERITNDFMSRRSKLPQHGILDLISDYQRLTGEWAVGWRNPARVIVVGHSHGAVWAHYLTALYPQVPVAALVDLDANCLAWNADHGSEVQLIGSALTRGGALLSPLQACDSVLVKQRRVSLKDVVWPNVAENIEVQSKRWPAPPSNSPGLYFNYLFELSSNVRLDGSKTGITTFVSVREDHGAVTYPSSQAVLWAKAQLTALPWLPPLPSTLGKPAAR